MEDMVKLRLTALGFTITSEDDALIEYMLLMATNRVLSLCHIPAIPEALQTVVVDIAAGEFLAAKKGSGKLTDVDLAAEVAEIKEGDTTVKYAFGSGSTTEEQRLDALIDRLRNGHTGELIAHRRLAW